MPTLTEVLESSQGHQKELAASSRSSQLQQMRQQQSELSELMVQNAKSNVLPSNAEEISEADWSLYTFYLSFFMKHYFNLIFYYQCQLML